MEEQVDTATSHDEDGQSKPEGSVSAIFFQIHQDSPLSCLKLLKNYNIHIICFCNLNMVTQRVTRVYFFI